MSSASEPSVESSLPRRHRRFARPGCGFALCNVAAIARAQQRWVRQSAVAPLALRQAVKPISFGECGPLRSA
jgi:hypothetical protein